MNKIQNRTKSKVYLKNLGVKIKVLRELNGFTQVELAEKLGYSSSATISQIENGERGMKQEKLSLAAKVLNVRIEFLASDQALSPEDIKLSYLFFKYLKMPKHKRPGFFKDFANEINKL